MSSKRERKCYAHLFGDSDDPHLFIKQIGEGAESHAQLVRHVATGENRVRKVRLRRLDAHEVHEADNEIRIIQFLQKLPVPTNNTPRYAELLAHDDAMMLTGDDKTCKKWSRESHWRYYNGGDLSHFKWKWMEEGIEIPRPIIARLIGQVCHTLWFFQSGPVSVFHRDLNASNIFLDWEEDSPLPNFIVGDFGYSDLSTEVDTDYLSLDEYRQCDVSYVLTHAKSLLYRILDGKIAALVDIRKVISESGPLKIVFEELGAFVSGAQSNATGSVPTLERIARLAERAEQELLATCFVNTRAFCDKESPNMRTSVPKYSHGKHRALSARRILGPWQLARVDPVTGAVLAVHPQLHHRPNQHNDDSDTDEDDDRVFVGGSSGDDFSSTESFVDVAEPEKVSN